MKKETRRARPSRRPKSGQKSFSYLSKIKDTSSTVADDSGIFENGDDLNYESVSSIHIPSQKENSVIWGYVKKLGELIGIIGFIGGIVITIIVYGMNLMNKVDNIKQDVDSIDSRTESIAKDNAKQSETLETMKKYVIDIRNDFSNIELKEAIIREIKHNK